MAKLRKHNYPIEKGRERDSQVLTVQRKPDGTIEIVEASAHREISMDPFSDVYERFNQSKKQDANPFLVPNEKKPYRQIIRKYSRLPINDR